MDEPTDFDPLETDDDEDDFSAHVVTALTVLKQLGRPSTSAERSRLWREHKLHFRISAFLGRKGAIGPPPGEPDDARRKLRVVTAKGDVWLADPTQIVSAAESSSGRLATVHRALAEFAAAEGLPVGPVPHILRSKNLWPSNLWAPLREHRAIFPADADLHRWVHHLRSSQAFAFNLFGPLAAGSEWARALWRPIFGDVRRVRFEYPTDGDPDGDDPLAERTPERPHRTRVDVRVDHGADEATLIEVKLTEREFGGCSAARDAGNPYRATCTTPDLSLEEVERECYLAQTAGRTYFERLRSPGSLLSPTGMQSYSDDGCPMRGGLYQLARNLMIAHDVRAPGTRVGFAVVAPGPSLNPALHGERSLHGLPSVLALLQSIVHDAERDAVSFIDFAPVVERAAGLGADAARWADYMTRKYVRPLTGNSAAH